MLYCDGASIPGLAGLNVRGIAACRNCNVRSEIEDGVPCGEEFAGVYRSNVFFFIPGSHCHLTYTEKLYSF